jgi:hypothetical protein
LMLASHAIRATARRQRHIGLLDRGLPMLIAAAAATSAVKDNLSPEQALVGVEEIMAESGLVFPPEAAILLMPSLDTARSYAITSVREGRLWTGVYVRYQHTLHTVLNLQADRGVFTAVIDCEGRGPDEVHADVLAHAKSSLNPALLTLEQP